MAEEKTYVFGDGAGSPGFGWGNGFGSFNSIADLFGLAIIASMFGWGNGGWGGGFGGFGGGNGAGFLSNQLNNDSGRELIMNAINAQGEASRSAIQNLATALGQDFNLVNAGVQNVQNALSTLASQQGMSTLQVINAIQSGNSALAAQFSQCCCENRLSTCQQTNTLTSAITSASQRNADGIADLKSTMISEFCAARERDMQEKIDGLLSTNATLKSQIDNANQSNQIIGYINSVVTPIQTKVNEIAAKQPNTVPVTYPNLQVYSTTPVASGFYGAGYGYGYGVPGGSYWG